MASETTRDTTSHFMDYIEGLIQNRCNSSALAMRFISLEFTHWGRVIHIFVGKLTNIASVNGLSPSRHQSIIRTNAEIMLIGPLGTNFSEILIEIHPVSFKKMHLKISSEKWPTFCLGLNVLNIVQVCSCLYQLWILIVSYSTAPYQHQTDIKWKLLIPFFQGYSTHKGFPHKAFHQIP